MRVLATVLSLATLASAASAGPAPLTTFDDLMNALRGGHAVRLVADYERCELIADNEPAEAPAAVGGMAIDAWEWFDVGAVYNERAFVVFSHAALIEHPRRGMATNHVKFKVFADGEIVITARYLDPATAEETMVEKFFTRIADDDAGAVTFYRLD
jgi:hypothetical protein